MKKAKKSVKSKVQPKGTNKKRAGSKLSSKAGSNQYKAKTSRKTSKSAEAGGAKGHPYYFGKVKIQSLASLGVHAVIGKRAE